MHQESVAEGRSSIPPVDVASPSAPPSSALSSVSELDVFSANMPSDPDVVMEGQSGPSDVNVELPAQREAQSPSRRSSATMGRPLSTTSPASEVRVVSKPVASTPRAPSALHAPSTSRPPLEVPNASGQASERKSTRKVSVGAPIQLEIHTTLTDCYDDDEEGGEDEEGNEEEDVKVALLDVGDDEPWDHASVLYEDGEVNGHSVRDKGKGKAVDEGSEVKESRSYRGAPMSKEAIGRCLQKKQELKDWAAKMSEEYNKPERVFLINAGMGLRSVQQRNPWNVYQQFQKTVMGADYKGKLSKCSCCT